MIVQIDDGGIAWVSPIDSGQQRRPCHCCHISITAMGARSENGPRRPSGNRTHLVWLVHYPIFGGPGNRILRLAPVLRESGIDEWPLVDRP